MTYVNLFALYVRHSAIMLYSICWLRALLRHTMYYVTQLIADFAIKDQHVFVLLTTEWLREL